jgi:integrase
MTCNPSVSSTFEHASVSLPKLFPRGSPDLKLHPDVSLVLGLIDRLCGTSRIFASCLLISGARPYELLNVRYKDVDRRGMVYIRTAKGGDTRVLYCPPILDIIPVHIPDLNQPVFRGYNYGKFYRSLKPLLRNEGRVSHVHVPVGRMFRRAYTRGCQHVSSSDIQVVRRALGHKSLTSTHYYTDEGGELVGKDSKRHSRSMQRQSRKRCRR